MELVIRISEKDYEYIKELGFSGYTDQTNRIVEAISNGIVLPKQHGKIIDADSIPSYRIRGITEYCRGYNDRTTEVENAIVNASTIIKSNY